MKNIIDQVIQRKYNKYKFLHHLDQSIFQAEIISGLKNVLLIIKIGEKDPSKLNLDTLNNMSEDILGYRIDDYIKEHPELENRKIGKVNGKYYEARYELKKQIDTKKIEDQLLSLDINERIY